MLSALTGLIVSWLFVGWPRRMTAEEWIVHRRSFQRLHEPTRQPGRIGFVRASLGGVRILPDQDLALLRVASSVSSFGSDITLTRNNTTGGV